MRAYIRQHTYVRPESLHEGRRSTQIGKTLTPGDWAVGTWEFLVLCLQLFSKPETVSKYKTLKKKKYVDNAASCI